VNIGQHDPHSKVRSHTYDSLYFGGRWLPQARSMIFTLPLRRADCIGLCRFPQVVWKWEPTVSP
jgi:hypothetical protein